MGYPIRYRGRSPQRGPVAIPWDGPPITPGPFLGIAMAAWAFTNLAEQLRGFQFGQTSFHQNPGGYGWTKTLDCGFPAIRLPAAAYTSCPAGGTLVVSTSAWNSNASGVNNPANPLTNTVHYWDAVTTPFPPTGVRARPAQRWERLGVGRSFTYRSTVGVLLGGPIRMPMPVALATGWRVVGYNAPALPVTGRLPGFDTLDDRWTIYFPGIPGVGPRPIPERPPIPRPVARAVPAAGMREVKFNANTRAGRAFFAMYSAFNFLGDGYGFTRALWYSLPSEQRGSSRRLGSMVRDIWKNYASIDPLLAARNVAFWKLSDTVYGSVQGSMFNAIASRYGYALARVWSTLDSEINAHTKPQVDRWIRDRRQESHRGG